jgi:hypothetical protein
MRDIHLVSRVMAVFLTFLAACNPGTVPPAQTENSSPTTQQPPTAIPAPSATGTASRDFENFDPATFDQSTKIDNKWLTLRPGTRLVYEGFTIDNGKHIPRRLVSTVTDLTKSIDGVRSVVTWDQDYNADQLVEAEIAFFAQDKAGNVWRMGEHPEDFENGAFAGASTWISGNDQARAGIEMQGNPQSGSPSYSQGWAPSVQFTDRAQVARLGQQVCVKLGCYDGILVTDETSAAEPGAHQLKYYAAGIGNIKVDWKGADQTQETLELVEAVELSEAQMAEARAAAVELEKHAYEVSPQAYGQTSPAENPDGTSVIVAPAIPSATARSALAGPLPEVVVYASRLQQSDLSELQFLSDPDSPDGKMVGLPNEGDELNAPPEDDPHATLRVQVQSGIPYRCWIHMKVGSPKGLSTANVIWVQFSDAVDASSKEMLKPGTDSYLTAQGSLQPGWEWVGCDFAGSESLIYFKNSGEVTVRLQAGMEGVGFDQLVLSSAKFLKSPPQQAVVGE